MTPPSCSHQRRLNVKVRELGSAYRQFQRLGRCAHAPGAAEKGERPGGSRKPMDPTLHGTRGAGVLSLTLSQGRARPPSTGWSYSVVAASVQPRPSSKRLRQQNASHRQLDDHRRRPAAKDNQQLPTDLPKRASCPAGVPATGERPGHQTGLSSSRGVRLFPRRPAARASWFGAPTPLGVAQSPLRVRARPPSARARRPSRGAWKMCLLCPWAGAAQSRAARLNAASDLGSPARLRPKAPIGRARGRSAAE